MKIETEDQYKTASDRWLAIQRVLDDPCLDGMTKERRTQEIDRATQQLIQLEQAMEASPFEFDVNGNVVRKPLKIEEGPKEGRYFTQWRWDELVVLADEIFQTVPAATTWRIWYDPSDDYHRLSFMVGVDYFEIRYYKIFALTKNGDERSVFRANRGNTTYLVRHIRDLVAKGVESERPEDGAGPEAAG